MATESDLIRSSQKSTFLSINFSKPHTLFLPQIYAMCSRGKAGAVFLITNEFVPEAFPPDAFPH